MQCADGGWGAFDADNTRALVRDLPFCDFGEVIDPPSADVTAHVVEMLARAGLAEPARRARGRALADRRAGARRLVVRALGREPRLRHRRRLPALVAAGVEPGDPRIRRAVRWLEEHQNDDGGWGEDVRSYDDPAWIGRGAEHRLADRVGAARAARGRRALGGAGGAASRWLVETQRADGSWDEPQYTGTGFPRDFYINYHLYRLVFPVMALGRCLERA